VVRAVVNLVVTVAIVLLIWQVIVWLAPHQIAKGPADVWQHLFVSNPNAVVFSQTAAGIRASLARWLGQTLADAGLGFGVGMAIAIILAVVFSLSRSVEAGVMPFALFLRTVPLVALVPVIDLIVGIGTPASVATIASIVVLFPALASVMFGLAQASPQTLDVVSVFGGNRFPQLVLVTAPGAVPSIFAAARVSVPGAITGALLAEWLSTGQGLGGELSIFLASSKFVDLWTAVAGITLLTLVIYNVVAIVERIVLQAMHMQQATDA
jgi:ABC-type nitrate/sulfonate/bicarbonate transport system permease component